MSEVPLYAGSEGSVESFREGSVESTPASSSRALFFFFFITLTPRVE